MIMLTFKEVEFLTCGRRSRIIMVQFQSFLCDVFRGVLVPRKKARDRLWFQTASSDPQDVVLRCEVSAADMSTPPFN